MTEEEKLSYKLPDYSDADEDQDVSIAAYLNSNSALPGFIKFDGKKAFTFSPKAGDAGTYQITLVLEDDYPEGTKESEYSFSLIVQPKIV